MTAGTPRTLALATALVPAAQRERFREEWAGNIIAAAEIGEGPGQLSRAALRTAVGMRLAALTARTGLLSLAGTALALGGVMSVATIGVSSIPVAVVAILAGLALVAVAATRALGSGRLPWLLFDTLSVGLAVAVASVVEINLLFGFNDDGTSPGTLVTAMIVTGIIGVAALAASIALGIALIVALARRERTEIASAPPVRL